MASSNSSNSISFNENPDGATFSYSSVSTTLPNSSHYISPNVKIGSETSTNRKSDMANLTVPEMMEQFFSARENQIVTELNKKIEDSLSLTAQKLTALTESKQAEITTKLDQEKINLMQSISESESRLQEVKNSVLATIAIFASFFTFISVSINIFSKATIIESIGLLIILWCCIFSFTYTFFLFTFNKWRVAGYWLPFLITMLCSVACLYWISANNMGSRNNSAEQKKISAPKESIATNSKGDINEVEQ